jgi:hypothetical protein
MKDQRGQIRRNVVVKALAYEGSDGEQADSDEKNYPETSQ